MADRKRKKRVEAPDVNPEWFKLLENHGGSHQPEPVPPGWMTTRDLAKAWGLSISSVNQKVKRMKDKGLVEVRSFQLMQDKVRPVPHYKVKSGAVRPGAK